MLPPRFLRRPEDVGGAVLVWVFRIHAFGALALQLGVLGFKGIGASEKV